MWRMTCQALPFRLCPVTQETRVYNVRMTWQALPVRPCLVTQETRVYNDEDDVAGIICQALHSAARRTLLQGNSGNTPGTNAPGHTNGNSGNSGNTPGAPGNSGNTPGNSGNAPGRPVAGCFGCPFAANNLICVLLCPPICCLR